MTRPEEFRSEVRAWLSEHFPGWGSAEGVRPGDELTFQQQRSWQRYLHDHGWGAPGWPEEYGGRGLGVVEQMIWTEEKARAGAQTFFNLVGYGMAGPTIISHGSEEQKQRFLPPMLRGDEVWCQLFSEPGAGSDLAAVATRAELRDGTWVVNGQKVWSSGAHEADWGILLARHDPSVPKHQGLVYLLCDMRSPGVEIRPLRQMDGGSHFGEVFLSDVEVPDRHRVGEPGEGWTVARTTLMHERMSLGGALGDYGLSFDRLKVLAAERGRRDAEARDALVDVYAQRVVLDVLNARIVSKLEAGQIPTAEGSIVKLLMSRMTTASADLGTLLLGPAAAAGPDDTGVRARLLAERAIHIGGGTDDVQRNAIAERVLGLPRDPQPDRDIPFRELRR